MVYYRWLEKWKERKRLSKVFVSNETTVSKQSVDKDKVTMYAQWKQSNMQCYMMEIYGLENGKPDGNVWNSNVVE